MLRRIGSFAGSTVLTFSLAASVDGASLLTNGDFERAPYDLGWTSSTGVLVAETGVPIGGSGTSARLPWNTTGDVRQSVPGVFAAYGYDLSDFELDFTFRHLGTTQDERTMNAVLDANGTQPAVNMRVLVQPSGPTDDVLQVYDGGWQTVSPSGSFSSTTAPYRIHLSARDWGTPQAQYDLRWSDAGSEALTHSATNLAYFQSASSATAGDVSRVRFHRQHTTSHSWLVDDAELTVPDVLLYESFAGADETQPPGFVPYASSGIVSQLDGDGEYEQARSGSGTTTIATYDVPDDTDRGAWRDTTINALLRYSGGGNNQNGIVFRADDISNTGSGDFYHARMSGDVLRLYRVRNGSFTQIATDNTGGGVGGSVDRLMRIEVENIPAAETDDVRIQVSYHDGASVTDPVLRSIDYTDTSTSAITRSGGVGFRSYNTAAGTRATFDDLVVSTNNRGLLWYDDYFDNTARRTETFVSPGVNDGVTGRKLQFGGVASGNLGLALIDWDEQTSRDEWADIEASALMRLNTGNSGGTLGGGVVLRETGVNSSGGSGDYYHYRLWRQEPDTYRAQLWRVVDGNFSQLDWVTLDAAEVPESQNIFLKALVYDLPDGVHIQGMASLDPDFANPYGVIDYVDAAADRITGPGSVGFRVYGSNLSNGTVNFDNLTVLSIHIPEPSTFCLIGLAVAALGGRRRG